MSANDSSLKKNFERVMARDESDPGRKILVKLSESQSGLNSQGLWDAFIAQAVADGVGYTVPGDRGRKLGGNGAGGAKGTGSGRTRGSIRWIPVSADEWSAVNVARNVTDHITTNDPDTGKAYAVKPTTGKNAGKSTPALRFTADHLALKSLHGMIARTTIMPLANVATSPAGKRLAALSAILARVTPPAPAATPASEPSTGKAAAAV